VIETLDELVDLVRSRRGLYVRWSRGPAVDADRTSRDELTGAELPGLCANPLDIEDWWPPRPPALWVARRVYDYWHLRDERDDVRPWVLTGELVGRGPDNEPLVGDAQPVAWLGERATAEARRLIDEHADVDTRWGPMRRAAPDPG
jgi:hypothetical protein